MDTDQQNPTPELKEALARYNGRYSTTKRGYVVKVVEQREGNRVLVEGIGQDGWRRRFLVKSENLEHLCELF